MIEDCSESNLLHFESMGEMNIHFYKQILSKIVLNQNTTVLINEFLPMLERLVTKGAWNGDQVVATGKFMS